MLIRHRYPAVLVLAYLCTSCADPTRYQGAVTKFHDATAVVIAAAKTTYSGLNQAERQHYVDLQVAARKPIDPDQLDKVQILGANETAIRMNSLNVLAKFSDLLVQLATSQSATAAQGKINDLQQALTTLSGDVDQAAGTNSAQFQAKAKSVFPLLGTALQAFENAKTVAALKSATAAAVKPMNDFIAVMEIDMRLAQARERNFLSKRRSDGFVLYRADLEANANAAKLRADADSILQLELQWEAFGAQSPTAGLEAMKQAYTSLADFVRKPKPSGSDFQTLLGEVDSFVNIAGQAGQAVKALDAK
jgi:hypothetical protein